MDKTIVIIIALYIVVIPSIIYFSEKTENLKNIKEVSLKYYNSTETLLDSLQIGLDDSIFNTKTGINYLNNKYTFDSYVTNK